MAKLINYALKLMEQNLDPALNPTQNPEINVTQNPELNDTQNPKLAISQNPAINPMLNPDWKKEEWKLLIEYLGDYLTDRQKEICKQYLLSL